MKKNPLDQFGIFLVSVFPISLIVGNFLINTFIFLFSINFFFKFKRKQDNFKKSNILFDGFFFNIINNKCNF